MASRADRAPWTVRLFGKLDVRVGREKFDTLPGRRTKELLCYVLLFRERPHHREVLAGKLWPESDTAQSRKYLRQSLWHLRALDRCAGDAVSLLDLETDWVAVRCVDLWLDVAEVEDAFAPVRLVVGEELTGQQARRLQQVVSVYGGDLMEGCYLDWCVYERERLKALYIALLEKLLGYYEAQRLPEEGITYGEELLRQDPAHERAHWRLMRLHYLSGNRTAALRQFKRCSEALADELGVLPGNRTVRLHEQIRADRGIDPPCDAPVSGTTAGGPLSGPPADPAPRNVSALHEALRALFRAENLVQQTIRATRERHS
ncbi:MAG TPA: BTAD domain-containing putative transcriptional regulator [Egibacteraceae bacterium]|jgi:DNA-binding SARP family transcriptional activator|nr:BTAD domain-containing putative transcriptional regulator [Egibacteraceae bacterium]